MSGSLWGADPAGERDTSCRAVIIVLDALRVYSCLGRCSPDEVTVRMSLCGKAEKVSFGQREQLGQRSGSMSQNQPRGPTNGHNLINNYLAELSLMFIEGDFCLTETRKGRSGVGSIMEGSGWAPGFRFSPES